MALKEWKIITKLRYIHRWENKRTSENLILVKTSSDDWIVYSWKLSAKRFKKKSQALAYAKKYMRNN